MALGQEASLNPPLAIRDSSYTPAVPVPRALIKITLLTSIARPARISPNMLNIIPQAG